MRRFFGQDRSRRRFSPPRWITVWTGQVWRCSTCRRELLPGADAIYCQGPGTIYCSEHRPAGHIDGLPPESR